MRSEQEVKVKMEEFQGNLALTLEKTAEELKKPYHERNRGLLWFLHKEKCVLEFALSGMKWMLSEQEELC
jgi:hypothetical protein